MAAETMLLVLAVLSSLLAISAAWVRLSRTVNEKDNVMFGELEKFNREKNKINFVNRESNQREKKREKKGQKEMHNKEENK
jgi:hypothetical protein